MEILFRKFRRSDSALPDKGEMHVRPCGPEYENRRDFARLVFEQGVGIFAGRQGPIGRVVVDADPTLDDLLAATFIIRLLAGDKLPEGAQAFALYAALVREGLKPSDVPLEDSLEGIFLALRNAGGGDLTDAAVGQRFAADWERVAARILRAAEQGVDPFTTKLFSAGPEFARERAFLVRDSEVFRQDVNSGEQWSVSIPGGPPQGKALLLRCPKSLLFKYWSRRREESTAGEPFLLLAVTFGAGQWVFSTDPIQRLPLKALADELQAAEVCQDPSRAHQDPWFDGKPFGYTLVAAPKGGTVLLDAKVLHIVKGWAGASRRGAGNLRRTKAVLTVVVMLAFLGLYVSYRPNGSMDRGLELDEKPPVPGQTSAKGNLYLVSVGISHYQNKNYNLEVARKDAQELGEVFRRQGKTLFDRFPVSVMLLDELATHDNIIQALAGLGRKVQAHDLVIVTLSGHGDNFGRKDDFYFLPYDFDPARKEARSVNRDDFTRFLGGLGCRVLLVLDTCHSGAVTKQLRNKDDNKMVVMAACLGSKLAKESQKWGHGALTLALLEGLQGKHLYTGQTATPWPEGNGPNKIITLYDLNHYITKRVQELTKSEQAFVSSNTGDFALNEIKIASLKSADLGDGK